MLPNFVEEKREVFQVYAQGENFVYQEIIPFTWTPDLKLCLCTGFPPFFELRLGCGAFRWSCPFKSLG